MVSAIDDDLDREVSVSLMMSRSFWRHTSAIVLLLYEAESREEMEESSVHVEGEVVRVSREVTRSISMGDNFRTLAMSSSRSH
jgi:hypothetical protein